MSFACDDDGDKPYAPRPQVILFGLALGGVLLAVLACFPGYFR